MDYILGTWQQQDENGLTAHSSSGDMMVIGKAERVINSVVIGKLEAGFDSGVYELHDDKLLITGLDPKPVDYKATLYSNGQLILTAEDGRVLSFTKVD